MPMKSLEVENSAIYLPWANRTAEQWQSLAKRNEAARLFMLVDPTATFTPEILQQHQLVTPFGLYWNTELAVLAEDIKHEQSFEMASLDDIERYAQLTSSIFSKNPNLFNFLLSMRSIMKKLDFFPGIHDQTTLSLGLNAAQAEQAKYGMQQLIELFWPQTLQFARMKSRKGGLYDSLEEQAGELITRAVINYYWEPTILDPSWSTSRFLTGVKGSFYPPVPRLPHIRPLEVIDLQTLPSSDDTVETAINNEAIQFLNLTLSDPIQRQIAYLHIIEGRALSELAKQLGISYNRATKLWRKAKEKLLEVINIQEENEDENRDIIIWYDVITRFDEFKAKYEARKSDFTPFYQELGEKLFSLNPSTDNIVGKSGFIRLIKEQLPNLKESTIDRQLRQLMEWLQKGTGKNGNGGLGFSTSAFNRARDTEKVKMVRTDEHRWAQLDPKVQSVIELFYFSDDPSIQQSQVANKLGLTPSTVSRIITNFRQNF